MCVRTYNLKHTEVPMFSFNVHTYIPTYLLRIPRSVCGVDVIAYTVWYEIVNFCE